MDIAMASVCIFKAFDLYTIIEAGCNNLVFQILRF